MKKSIPCHFNYFREMADKMGQSSLAILKTVIVTTRILSNLVAIFGGEAFVEILVKLLLTKLGFLLN